MSCVCIFIIGCFNRTTHTIVIYNRLSPCTDYKRLVLRDFVFTVFFSRGSAIYYSDEIEIATKVLIRIKQQQQQRRKKKSVVAVVTAAVIATTPLS